MKIGFFIGSLCMVKRGEESINRFIDNLMKTGEYENKTDRIQNEEVCIKIIGSRTDPRKLVILVVMDDKKTEIAKDILGVENQKALQKSFESLIETNRRLNSIELKIESNAEEIVENQKDIQKIKNTLLDVLTKVEDTDESHSPKTN